MRRTPPGRASHAVPPYQVAAACAASLHAHILAMDIHARMDVVKEIPARMIWVFVNDEVISAVPAPVGTQRPVPCGHFKKEAAGKPEAVKTGVEPDNPVTVARPKMRKMPVRKRMIQVETRVIPLLVAKPLIVIDVRGVIHMPRRQMLCLALFLRIVSRRRRRWDVLLVRARRIGRRIVRGWRSM